MFVFFSPAAEPRCGAGLTWSCFEPRRGPNKATTTATTGHKENAKLRWKKKTKSKKTKSFLFQETADLLEVITAFNVLELQLYFSFILTTSLKHQTWEEHFPHSFYLVMRAYLRRGGSASSPLPSKPPVGEKEKHPDL